MKPHNFNMASHRCLTVTRYKWKDKTFETIQDFCDFTGLGYKKISNWIKRKQDDDGNLVRTVHIERDGD